MTTPQPYTLSTAIDLVIYALDDGEHECPEHADCDHPSHDEDDR